MLDLVFPENSQHIVHYGDAALCAGGIEVRHRLRIGERSVARSALGDFLDLFVAQYIRFVLDQATQAQVRRAWPSRDVGQLEPAGLDAGITRELRERAILPTHRQLPDTQAAGMQCRLVEKQRTEPP